MADNSILNNSIKMNSNSIFSNVLSSHKVISFFIIEEELQKIFVTLDSENYLYVWLLKNDIINTISLLDEIDYEDKKKVFPDLCFNMDEFIVIYNNFSRDKKVAISNLNYLQNSNNELIQITGNFNSIILNTNDFLDYIKFELDKNLTKINKSENNFCDSMDILDTYNQKNIKGNYLNFLFNLVD